MSNNRALTEGNDQRKTNLILTEIQVEWERDRVRVKDTKFSSERVKERHFEKVRGRHRQREREREIKCYIDRGSEKE